jgi:antitoxin (DNA-binding transcriptional repressor) of toxin-antitoxin stability system
MKTIELDDATKPLAEYAHNVNGEPYILTRDGQPYAALVTLEDAPMHALLKLYADKLADEERDFVAEVESLSNNEAFIEFLGEGITRMKAEGGITHEELRRELGL